MDKTDALEIGSLEKIPLGQGRCFVVGREEIAVFRTRSGGVFAIQNRCPHRQGPLCEGVIDDQRVVCPYHGHKFDIRTGAGSEAGESVKAFEVTESQGLLTIKIKEPA
ncbi:MAG TPA: Rieske 2Fe-2S domain-containing protein [bacterium]|nr:Rieske 2Fe-2S domain-containing protein [bacterium]